MPKQQRKRAAEEEHDSTGEEPQNKKTKKTASFTLNTDAQTDESGDKYWEISNRRRLTISNFKGNTMVGIREYFEKDGKMLPGNKGVSLTSEQFNAVIELLPHVEPILKAKGLEVSRPQYSQGSNGKSSSKPAEHRKQVVDDVSDDEDDEEEVKPKPAAKSKLDKYKLKANHEATSEEDGD